MRVAIASDLHLGTTPASAVRSLASAVAAQDFDAVVLAGDVAESPSLWLDCLRIFSGACDGPALYALPGNHDLHAREGCTSRDLFERLLPSLARDAGFAWLEGNPLVRGGAAVAGTAAWYDYSAAEPGLDQGPAWYSAHRHALVGERFDADWDDRAFAAERSAALLADLDGLERDPAVETVLVVTHVPIFEGQLSRKPWDPEWAVRTAYFGNLTLGAEVLRRRKVATVVSGHTHAGRRVAVYRKDGPPITAMVVGSDFGRPAFVAVEVGKERP